MKNLATLGYFISSGLIRDLELLADNHNCVLWIRNNEFDQQLFVSSTYSSIFARDCLDIYRHPDSWKESVNVKDTEKFFNELKNNRTLINPNYTAVFCINIRNNKTRWILDRSIHVSFSDPSHKLIIGCALPFTAKEDIERNQLINSDKLDLVITKFSQILITTLNNVQISPNINKSGIELLSRLSKREQEIFKLFIQGNTITQVANEIHLSPRTVEGYLITLKTKLDCDSKSELVMKAIENGWLLMNI